MPDGTSTIQGTIKDAQTRKGLAYVVITVTSPSLLGEQTQITDSSGAYKIENLPPGEYTVRAESEEYIASHRSHVQLHIEQATVLNMELLPKNLDSDIPGHPIE
jgi:hypothetical protein